MYDVIGSINRPLLPGFNAVPLADNVIEFAAAELLPANLPIANKFAPNPVCPAPNQLIYH